MTPSPADDTPAAVAGPSPRHRLGEVALLFLRLGFTAFGGPAAHVAMMEDEVVARRNWIDRQHFLDLFAAELAIPLGLIHPLKVCCNAERPRPGSRLGSRNIRTFEDSKVRITHD